jgi:hypothetical protein
MVVVEVEVVVLGVVVVVVVVVVKEGARESTWAIPMHFLYWHKNK